MLEIFIQLLWRFLGRPQPPSLSEDLAPWLACVLVATVAAIIYDAPKEAYVLLGMLLVLIVLFVSRRRSA